MMESNSQKTKELLDKAFAYLLDGEIKEAAGVFEYIIKNSHVYGGMAAHIAERGIKWYCVPLDAIFSEMQKQEFAIDIRAIIARQYRLVPDQDKNEFELIIKSVEDHLKKMPDYIRVGENFWTRRVVIEEFAQRMAVLIHLTDTPISLASIFEKGWPDFCLENPRFPDHYSEAALGTYLHTFHIKVLNNKLVITDRLLENFNNAFINKVNEAKRPICLKTLISEMFPTLSVSSEYITTFEAYVRDHLDSRLIEFTSGYYITSLVLQFDRLSFDELFSDKYRSCSNNELIKWRFPDLDNSQILPSALRLIQSQLNKNQSLVKIGEGTWFSRKRLDGLHSQVMEALLNHEDVVSLPDLVKPLAPDGMRSKELYLFQEVVLTGLRRDSQAIPVTQIDWLHRSKIASLLEKAYPYLLEVKKASIDKILLALLSGLSYSTIKDFSHTLESYLSKDPRFSRVSNNRDEWLVIPKGQRDNDKILDLLSKLTFPLTDEQILDNLKLTNPEYDLIADSRFQSFPKGRWGLAHWIWLNDKAYEYLLRTRQSLHGNVIIGLVCKVHGFPRKYTIFMPEDDRRFSRDNLNRWFCRYQLKPEDLNNLLKKLGQYAGMGRKLDHLLQEVLRLHPDATNAYEALSSDSRFIELEDQWYSRQQAFRDLSSEDIEKIYNYFSALPTDSAAVSIKNVGLNALGWDGRLTNAATLLATDDRFVEDHLGFWSLKSWSAHDYDRISHGGVAVLGPTHREKTDELPSEFPTTLTRRRAHQGVKSLPKEAQKTFYHTLSHLDILHGNIRIAGLLKKWIPEATETIVLNDNDGNEVVAYIDETRTILNIRDWIHIRELEYGDKISIHLGPKQDILFIRPYGKRDERVYQEALQHQDIEKLIAEARLVKKTYHDLMIEVMESFGMVMHREDIFQLVDYQRTATRSTIFEILSLTECPYVELRYFVPKGKGFWMFDRQRKKAFDMKMNELLDENNSLKGQVALLSNRLEKEPDTASRLRQSKQKIDAMEQTIIVLNNEKTSLSSRILALEADKSQGDQFNSQLIEQLNQVQQQLLEIKEKYSVTSGELATLRLEKQSSQEIEIKLQEVQSELECARLELKILEEKVSELPVLHAELEQNASHVVELSAELDQYVARLTISQAELEQKDSQLITLHGILEQNSIRQNELQSELEKSIQLISQIQSESMKQVMGLNNEIETAGIQLAQLEVAYNNLLKELEELRVSGSRSQEELSQAKEDRARLEEELAEVKFSRMLLQKEFDVLQTQAHYEIVELKEKHATVTADNAEMVSRLQSTLDELILVQSHKGIMETRFTELGQEFDAFKKQAEHEVSSLNLRIQSFEDQLDKRDDKIQSINAQLAEVISEKTVIENESASNRANLTQQLSTLQSKLSALNLEYAQQCQQLTVLSNRLKKINQAFATPLGRLFARLNSLK